MKGFKRLNKVKDISLKMYTKQGMFQNRPVFIGHNQTGNTVVILYIYA